MGKTWKKQTEERSALITEQRKRDVFLVVSDVDWKWLQAEAKRREKDRSGYEPEDVKVQPVIYDLIREARPRSAQA